MAKQETTPRRTKPRLKFNVHQEPAPVLLFIYTCGQLHQNTLSTEMFVQERPCWHCFLKNCPKGTFPKETFYEGSLAITLMAASSKTTPPVKQKQQLS